MVGLIGLGRMGSSIAARLLGAGHELVVHDLFPERAAALAGNGANVADSVAAVAGAVADRCPDHPIVITMLPDDAALAGVSGPPDGLTRQLPPGGIHVAMGTHGVDTIRALAAAHTESGRFLVAAPVLGRPEAAAAGALSIVAAGPPDAVDACRPLFSVMAQRVFAGGSAAEGAAAIKLARGLVLGSAIETLGEAFSLVHKCGVAPALLHELLTNEFFSAPAYEIYGRIIVDEAYDPAGFTARLGLKDVNLILAAGETTATPLPSANVLRDRLLSAVAHGDADKDWAVVARVQARMSGLQT
jgi:3-hydroxyisobutyrate dehydrogenase-like beta-hydroxyacid dehydrogenase